MVLWENHMWHSVAPPKERSSPACRVSTNTTAILRTIQSRPRTFAEQSAGLQSRGKPYVYSTANGKCFHSSGEHDKAAGGDRGLPECPEPGKIEYRYQLSATTYCWIENGGPPHAPQNSPPVNSDRTGVQLRIGLTTKVKPRGTRYSSPKSGRATSFRSTKSRQAIMF